MSDKNVSPQSDFTSTPPTYKKVRNPFDKVLIDKLHKPICSPSMCKIYKKESRGSFRWDIDQTCTLLPADIVACSSQFEPSPDPNLEKIAEEATDKFFSQEMVMPSPLESSKKVKPLLPASTEADVLIESFKEKSLIMKDVSAQTVLSLPPELPPELEKMLQPYFTYNQEHDMFGEYEITANGSLRRKLFFEDHSGMTHQSECESEQTDEENHQEVSPPSNCETHAPVVFSPDLYRDFVKKGMKRTFGTPLKKGPGHSKAYRNKILDVVDFGDNCLSPINFNTPPKRLDQQSGASSSITSSSISPVTKVTSSDDEKANFTSPESEAMATCLDCIVSDSDPESGKKGRCFCKSTSTNANLKRSASLKDSPPRSRKNSVSFLGKRSLSLSSLHRSRSVQKLDFSMNMSVDGSIHSQSQAASGSSPLPNTQETWSLVGDCSIQHLVNVESQKEQYINSHVSSRNHSIHSPVTTPIKGKTKSSVRHEISKIRDALVVSPMDMSLDNSLENSDNPLGLEDKKIDFNNIDLKFLTDNITKFDYTAADATKNGTTSFKKVDSGFNENTFYTNASSYYESAIKPSELTITNTNTTVLKEISNVHWARVDSGFRDETSSDNTHFYTNTEAKSTGFRFTEAKLENKENVMSEDFGRFLAQPSNRNDVMSMSDVFPEDITFTCNFSSTPSKSKPKNLNA
ncbi:hypothetical protein MSG28_007594 [Choristoneura fumiferana]|uniref:Uncharacterized protein n=1 Tax=Choristoneura fumiferana TaxID=7141 RepID=A0ACC0JY99_CHOFU|nr:hypothetical protein MSG28_007594 [Choristoneura fumiferana]